MTPKVIEGATVEPLTVTECRAHLEAQSYGDSDVDPVDDEMIEAMLSAAREYCEAFTGLSLATKTLEIALDEFPLSGAAIDLPGGPVREIISVSWGDESDEEMAAADYVLDTYMEPHSLKPVATAWPVVTAATNLVKVRYLVGYGVDTDGGEALPKMLRAAILLMVGHLYGNREATADQALAKLPLGVESLLRPHRINLGMA